MDMLRDAPLTQLLISISIILILSLRGYAEPYIRTVDARGIVRTGFYRGEELYVVFYLDRYAKVTVTAEARLINGDTYYLTLVKDKEYRPGLHRLGPFSAGEPGYRILRLTIDSGTTYTWNFRVFELPRDIAQGTLKAHMGVVVERPDELRVKMILMLPTGGLEDLLSLSAGGLNTHYEYLRSLAVAAFGVENYTKIIDEGFDRLAMCVYSEVVIDPNTTKRGDVWILEFRDPLKTQGGFLEYVRVELSHALTMGGATPTPTYIDEASVEWRNGDYRSAPTVYRVYFTTRRF